MTVTAAASAVPLHRDGAFRRFCAASTVSAFGDQMSALAVPLIAVIAMIAADWLRAGLREEAIEAPA